MDQPATIALWGPDHHEYGRIATANLGVEVAIALSRGQHPKRYAYTDPNEDVVAAVSDAGRRLLVVADGHDGHESASVAVRELLAWATNDELPRRMTSSDFVEVFHFVNERIRATTAAPNAVHPESRTTLVLAHIADGRLSFASMGDSALYLVKTATVERLDVPRSNRFVGYPMTPSDVAAAMYLGERVLENDDHVVLATDGFTDFALHADEALLAAHNAPSASQAAVQLVQRAFAGGAGDNIGVAICQ